MYRSSSSSGLKVLSKNCYYSNSNVHCIKGVHIRSFSRPYFPTWTEYGEIRDISPYSVWMRKITDQKNSKYEHILLSGGRNENFPGRSHTTQKIKFSITDFFSKCDQIRIKLWIFSHLLKKFLVESFIFVQCLHDYRDFFFVFYRRVAGFVRNARMLCTRVISSTL